MSAVLVGLLVVVAMVGVPVGFVYWMRAPRGHLLRRTAVVAAFVVAWLVLAFALFVEVSLSLMGGVGGGTY